MSSPATSFYRGRGNYPGQGKTPDSGGMAVIGLVILILFLLGGIPSCTRYVEVAGPSPVVVATPSPSATPPAARCASVSRAQGDCYRTDADVHLAAVEAAHDAAAREPGLTDGSWILGGRAYLDFVVSHLREGKMCAGIYENEEVAVWRDGDATSENWDLIEEPGNGGLKPRRGPGAHSYSCRPPTTEAGS